MSVDATLAAHVRTLGRGPGRARSLTQPEAREAMTLMLRGAAPEAVGALLMLLRMKGETPPEIAGFAQGARDALPGVPRADLDWPSYAAGRTRGLPWFLLSARLVAQAGHRVVLHGWNGGDPMLRDGLAAAGIAPASVETLEPILTRHRIAYLPLEDLSPALFGLLGLRGVLGLRSCVNTVCRMLNPCGAAAMVQGVFHPSYRDLQCAAAELLGQPALGVIKGGGGEFEVNPAKDVTLMGVGNGDSFQITRAATWAETRRMDDGARDPRRLTRLWEGALEDGFATEIVLGTADLALRVLGDPVRAADLWAARHSAQAA